MFGLKRLEISHADGVVHLPQPSGPEAFNSQNVFFYGFVSSVTLPKKKERLAEGTAPNTPGSWTLYLSLPLSLHRV